MNTLSRRMADGFRIYAALVWKEWREQRIIIAVMVLAAALLPEAAWGVGRLGPELPFLAFCLWVVFALVLGAGIFTNDASSRANEFMGGQPLKGGTVWLAKMAFGMMALLVLVQLSATMTYLKLAANGAFWPNPQPSEECPPLSGAALWSAESLMLIVAVLPIVIFLLTSLLGSLLSRALDAFVVSLIVCGGCVAANQALRETTSMAFQHFNYPALGFIGIPLAIGLSLLVCSRLVFPLPARRWWRKLAAAFVGTVAACAAAGILAIGVLWLTERFPALCKVYFTGIRPGSDTALSLQPGGGVVAVSAGSDWWAPRIWLARTDGSGARRISPGFSEVSGAPPFPPWSADGQALVYITHSRADSPFLSSDDPRAMLYDVKTDRSRALPIRLPPEVGYRGTQIGFAGEDDRIFFSSEWRMGLCLPDGRIIKDQLGTVLGSGWACFGGLNPKENGPRGWMNLATGQLLDLPDAVINISPSGRWALLAKRGTKPSNLMNDMVLWNTQERSATPVAEVTENGTSAPAFCHSEFSPDERFLAVQYVTSRTGGEEHGPLVVFDLKTRRVTLRRENVAVLPSPSFSPDGRRLVYGREVATQLKAQPTLSICHLANLDSGEDIVVGTREQIAQTRWSPDGSKIALTSAWRLAPARLFVFDTATKEAREIPLPTPSTYAWPVGWVDDGTVLLATQDFGGGSALWAAKADGTGVKKLFP